MLRPDINVTPLIDVLLVLLIIFMIITPTRPSRFEARIPAEPTDQPGVINHPHTLIVAIDPDHRLLLNGKHLATVTSPSALIEELRAVFAGRYESFTLSGNDGSGRPHIERTVFIKAPTKIAYGHVASIVDAVRMAGADPVSLQIDDLN